VGLAVQVEQVIESGSGSRRGERSLESLGRVVSGQRQAGVFGEEIELRVAVEVGDVVHVTRRRFQRDAAQEPLAVSALWQRPAGPPPDAAAGGPPAGLA